MRVLHRPESELIRQRIRKLPEGNEHLRRESHFLFVGLILLFKLLHHLFERNPLAFYCLVQSEAAVLFRRNGIALCLEVVQPHTVGNGLGTLHLYIYVWTRNGAVVRYVLADFFRELALHRLPTGFVLLRVAHAAFLTRDVSLPTRQHVFAYLAVELALNE